MYARLHGAEEETMADETHARLAELERRLHELRGYL